MTATAESGWDELAVQVGSTLAAVKHGQFLIIEYRAAEGWDPCPYAQCAREVDSWYCEIVSQNYLPADRWPIDELNLRRGGWVPPADDTENWWQEVDTFDGAAALLIAGLRAGRMCPDPDHFTWSIGTFPSGPDGGEPVPVPDYAPLLQAA